MNTEAPTSAYQTSFQARGSAKDGHNLPAYWWFVFFAQKPGKQKSQMNTKTLEIAIDEPQNGDYPNCYASIPSNGKVCSHTGLRHTHLYTMLAAGGAARPYVRVVNLREPGASKGKTIFHVGDFFRYLDWHAQQQGSGEQRSAIQDRNITQRR